MLLAVFFTGVFRTPEEHKHDVLTWLTLDRLNVDLDDSEPVFEDEKADSFNAGGNSLWGIHVSDYKIGKGETHWAYVDMRDSVTGLYVSGPAIQNFSVISAGRCLKARATGSVPVVATVSVSTAPRRTHRDASLPGYQRTGARCAVKAKNTNRYDPMKFYLTTGSR